MAKILRFRLRTLMGAWSDQHGQRLTYADLTEATGIAASTLSHLAQNKSRRIDASTIERLCEFFRCGLDDLMVLEDDPDETNQEP